jgi:integrase
MGKHANGTGTTPKKMKNRDLYRAKYTDANGKQKSVYGKNYEDCREKLTEKISERDNGFNFDANGLTVEQFLSSWLHDSAHGKLGHRAYSNYKLQIERHINPALGTIKLDKLAPIHIQKMYRAKQDSGLSPSSVRYIHAVLHSAMTQATKWNLVGSNPVSKVDPPKLHQNEITPLTPMESQLFIEVAGASKYELFYALALTCGMRSGEILGLRESDIDYRGGVTLTVNRQVQRKRGGGGLVFSEPKQNSKRSIKLPLKASQALQNHYVRNGWDMAGILSNLSPEDGKNRLLFQTSNGSPIDAQNIVNRDFKPMLRDNELPMIRLHDLRHTCATLLLGENENPKYVQRLLGHSSIRVTLDLYSHYMPEMRESPANAMDRVLGGG